MFWRVWKVVETKTRKIGMEKTKEGRRQKRRENEMRWERIKKGKKRKEKTKNKVKQVIKKWEIQDKGKKAAKLEKETKKLVSPRFN